MPVGASRVPGQQHRRGERQGLEMSPEEMRVFLGGGKMSKLSSFLSSSTSSVQEVIMAKV